MIENIICRACRGAGHIGISICGGCYGFGLNKVCKQCGAHHPRQMLGSTCLHCPHRKGGAK